MGDRSRSVAMHVFLVLCVVAHLRRFVPQLMFRRGTEFQHRQEPSGSWQGHPDVLRARACWSSTSACCHPGSSQQAIEPAWERA